LFALPFHQNGQDIKIEVLFILKARKEGKKEIPAI